MNLNLTCTRMSAMSDSLRRSTRRNNGTKRRETYSAGDVVEVSGGER